MKQPPSTMLRMGTLNVRSLSGRLGGVLDLANLHALHVMCLQETRVHQDSWSAIRTVAGHCLNSVFTWLAETGEEAVILGDLNLEISNWPISSAQACGRWRACDEIILGDNMGNGTFRNADGKYSGSNIDFGLVTPHVHVCERLQFLGVADHDGVAYDFYLIDGAAKPWKLPPCPALSECSISSFSWGKHWMLVQEEFTTPASGDLDGLS